ncbi:hypothetical protein [Luteolibacter sp. LG18]|uniref:hypothetical protein n=1 Tax=Luteolibacter sp. LG18 TaxID=2819286 RepID=UPI0030C75378
MKAPFLWLAWVTVATAEVEVVAHPAVECAPGKTIVWTAAMQAAFDRLIGPKSSTPFDRVDPPNPLVARMRDFRWKEEDVLPKDGWFAVAGPSTLELTEQANAKWRKLVGGEGKPFSSGGSGLAAFVGIRRDFLFAKEFAPSGAAKLTWQPTGGGVKFFGVKGDASYEFGEQVRVLAFRPSEGTYALQFLSKKGDDTMILYLPKEGQPMMEAIRWVETWKRGWGSAEEAKMEWNEKRLHEGDDLRIPEIQLDAAQDLGAKFSGNLFFKKSQTPWRVAQATTSASLGVDAKGVKFQSTAAMEIRPFGGVTDLQKAFPRRFWFDRPFFLFLWREKAEWPCAAVWFGSVEGLMK